MIEYEGECLKTPKKNSNFDLIQDGAKTVLSRRFKTENDFKDMELYSQHFVT
jgi:hypothetical protein